MSKLIIKINFIIFLICVARNIILVISVQDTTTLELVAILHRHGDRTPTRTYENDPYKDLNTYWPIGLGQLTLKGKQQLYDLGKTFRKRYNSFVTKHSTKTVRVNSSDYDRCLMSVGALLAGMFPPEDEQIWNANLKWQPIPVHSIPITDDKILALEAPCPRYNLEHQKVLIELADNETVEDKLLYKYLTESMGQNISTIRDVEIMYATLLIEERNGLTLPAWTKLVYPEKMREKAKLSAFSFTWNKLMKRFYGGPVIKEILQKFKEKSEGGIEDMKLLIYSGHDNTIVSLLRALEFKEFLMPDFGASVIFELHRINDKYNIKMFYMHDTSQTEPTELQIPNCTIPCSLDVMLNITEYVRSVDWNIQCFE